MSEKNRPDETQPVRPQPGATSDPAATPAPEAAAAPPPAASSAAPETGPVVAASPAAAAGPGWGRFRRWRSQPRGERGFGLGALIASALAGIIVGGLGTAVFHAATDDHDRGAWMERHGPMGRGGFDGDDGDRGPMFGGPRGVPGQLQPTTPPEDDEGGSSS